MTWTCPSCQHLNQGTEVCDACGIARRWHEDPPLDLPRPPGAFEVPATWSAVAYGGLTLAGIAVLLVPAWRAALGFDPRWVLLEIALAAVAWVASVQEAWFQRRFNAAKLEVPRQVRTGTPVEVALTLVPYERVDGVNLTVELVDRFYAEVTRKGRRQVETRQRVMERIVLARGEMLAGRRTHTYRLAFDAPFPSTVHEHLGAQLTASVLEPLGFLVPGLRHHARNLREHGGFFVRVTLRRGLWWRRFEQRVVVVHVGATIAAG
ncbi:MAG: hypothetical protein P1P87_14815 [Trueperaceae bacterium]|nr:hypothetical protein [Trueperaceae bacterium]